MSSTLYVYIRRVRCVVEQQRTVIEDYVLYQVTRSIQRLGITGICATELKPSN